jgi:hypothetical protein
MHKTNALGTSERLAILQEEKPRKNQTLNLDLEPPELRTISVVKPFSLQCSVMEALAN